jgi:hypothetical protein
MLNPVVYSLRNKEVKRSFMKIVVEAKLSLWLLFHVFGMYNTYVHSADFFHVLGIIWILYMNLSS